MAEDFGVATVTPLFQTSFFPLFMQVYFLPAEVEVAPSFEQAAPALTTAMAFKGTANRAKAKSAPSAFFIDEG